MRIAQLRQVDLNLLVVFAALAEERSVSRAATRLLLSQPAVSRALQRLRDMFQDHLLVRGTAGYEMTPKGERVLQELSTMLPRVDRLLAGAEFDPGSEQATFRLAGTDNAATVLGPPLCRQLLTWFRNVTIQMFPWHDGAYEDLERGRLDLAFTADDGHTPERFSRELLYEDEFVCVVSKERASKQRIALKQYVRSVHIAVGTLAGRQTIPEQRLATLGFQRTIAIEVPYFSTACRCVAGTDLVATVPKRMAQSEPRDPRVRLVGAPAELGHFQYLMVWHPRVDTDAAHTWLRSQLRTVGRSLPALRNGRIRPRRRGHQ